MNPIILYVLLTASIALAEKKLPSYVNVCKRNDPKLSECWGGALQKLIPYLAKGIPEFHTDALTAFRIETLHMDQANTENVNFIADVTNLTFYGLEDLLVLSSSVNFTEPPFYINLVFNLPKLKMNGDYKATGRIMIFEFEGDGEMEGVFDNVTINWSWYVNLVKKKGEDYLVIEKDNMDIRREKAFMYIENIFKNNPEISKSINNAINENIDVLYEELKPLFEKILASALNDYASRVFSLYPFNVLLPME